MGREYVISSHYTSASHPSPSGGVMVVLECIGGDR